ncbi:MAG: phosphoglucosamine mutase [Clostridia bacterium]|nr:phosphoglucosamine mutase [Clostridia bacterium]
MQRMFGTDGVRGVANAELTADLAFALGRAGALVLTQELSHKPTLLVGRDTRISGTMLENALCAGICSTGASVISLGVIPTPAVAYLVRHYKADAGVMISASHNPFEYNGIKFFNADGYKLSDAVEDKIEAMIRENNYPTLPTGEHVGRYSIKTDATEDYIDFVTSCIDCRLDGMRIAIDCANGANSVAAPTALSQLGANVNALYNAPDGININAGCGSTHIDALGEYVKNNPGYDIGIAFDGDADRMLAVDETGSPLTGDEVMLIVGNHLKEQGLLTKDTITATVMSNLGFFLAAEKLGIHAVQTAVGDRYVLEEMLKEGYALGGEESGHIIYLHKNTTGDGLLSALLLLSVMQHTGKKLSELRKIVTILPQVLVNARVKNENKPLLKTNEVIVAEIEKLEAEMGGEGRVLIRPSGTEPVVRVMLEGNDKEVLRARAQKLAGTIEALLG